MNLNKIYFNKLIHICLNRMSSKILSQNSCLNRVLLREMTTNKRNISKSIDNRNIKSYGELKELINYENKFQESRKLSSIHRKDYKKMLTQECEDKNPELFIYKYDKIQTICEIYNQVLKKTFKVPAIITNDLMKHLIDLDNNEIYEQLRYLYNKEFQRWYEKGIRKQESIQTQERLKNNYEKTNASRIGIFNNNNQIVYGLWHNTLFTRIKEKHFQDLIAKTRLKTASIFGQNIVIDLSYEEYMNEIGIRELLSHILKLYNFNKYKLNDSFNINFCNLNNCGLIMEMIPKYFKREGKLSDYYITASSGSYLDRFPIEKLVYICPQADELLLEYDDEAVYVLCGAVQRRLDPPLSMSRVREEGVKMKRIPTEHYVNLIDKFSLEISHTLQILAHFRDQKDMFEAIERILPEYSKKTELQVEEEDEEKVKKAYRKLIDKQRGKKRYS